MNRYHDAMEHCAPPPELENRLRETVLSAAPGPQARTAVFRPRGFVRKAALAAVLIVLLTASAGAAVLVNWDHIFTDRFGPEGAETPMAEKAFQEVNLSSVCDDVTLTVRQALVDVGNLYLLLDYHLPDTISRETAQAAHFHLPRVTYYLTDQVTWEELEQADRDRWAELDWTDAASYTDYMGNTQNALAGFGLGGTYSTSTETTGYDPETHTITYLLSATASTPGADFTTQPLTLLVAPPVMEVGEQLTAVTDHPALLTFQPEAVSQTLTGSWREDGRAIRVIVSPFSITVELSGGTPYRQLGELKQDTSLVLRDGSLQPVAELTLDLSGVGGRGGEGSSFTDASFTSQFRELLDVSQVEAVQVGDVTIPLT